LEKFNRKTQECSIKQHDQPIINSEIKPSGRKPSKKSNRYKKEYVLNTIGNGGPVAIKSLKRYPVYLCDSVMKIFHSPDIEG
jgi:hypothetical protein